LDGKFIRTIGRAGQGPGEFQYPSEVRINKDETRYVLDGSSKIIYFDKDGKYLNQTSLSSIMRNIWITPAGTYLGINLIFPQWVGQDGKFETTHNIYN